jgi:hypothetical protein
MLVKVVSTSDRRTEIEISEAVLLPLIERGHILLLLRSLENKALATSVEVCNGVTIRRLPHFLCTHSVEICLETIVRPRHCDSISIFDASYCFWLTQHVSNIDNN